MVFIDDDVEVKPDFIQQHLAAYTDSKIGAAVGRVVVPSKPEPCLPGAPVGKITWMGGFVNNYESEEAQLSGNLIGCNFSLRRTILGEVGLFDENFIGNALREDSDMATRILKEGFLITFLPQAGVVHKQAVSGGTRSQKDRIKWYYDLFYNNFLFYGKWAKGWRQPFFILHMTRPILACSFWYGKGSISALTTPWRGIRAGLLAAKRSRFN